MSLRKNCRLIEKCFGSHCQSLSDIFEMLERESQQSKFCERALKLLRGKCQRSLYATFKLLRFCEGLKELNTFNLDRALFKCVTMAELMMANSDFNEGVGALLIEKTKKPKWADLTTAFVERVDEAIHREDIIPYDAKPIQRPYFGGFKQIYNVWQDMENFNCFGCSGKNPSHMNLVFFTDGKTVECEYFVKEESFPSIAHGGVVR